MESVVSKLHELSEIERFLVKQFSPTHECLNIVHTMGDDQRCGVRMIQIYRSAEGLSLLWSVGVVNNVLSQLKDSFTPVIKSIYYKQI